MLASLVRVLASFGFGIALARLLPPEDFGIVGMALIATSFVYVVADLGLGPAIIQRKAITERHIRVCHTISVTVAVLLTAALWGSAGLIADFFNDTRVAPVLRVLAFAFLFSGWSITSGALLVRRFAFKVSVKIEVLASIVGYGGVAVAMAFAGFGYWSLVGGTLAQAMISSVLTYLAERHALRPLVARAEIKDLVAFSTGMSLTSMVNFFALKGDYFVVGRMMNATSLGFYSRAYTLMELPLVFFGSALSRVLFPAAARVQDEPERFRRAYLTTLSISVAVSLPISFAVVILAPEIILALYGDAWAPTIPLLQILSLFGMFRMTYNTASTFVRARGQVYRLLLCSVVYGVLVVGGSWWGASIAGMEEVAWAVGGAITTMWLLVVAFANRAAAVSLGEFARALAFAVAPGLAISLGLFGLVNGLRGLKVPSLALVGVAGSIFAVAFAWSLLYQARQLDHAAVSTLLERSLLPVSRLRSRIGHMLFGTASP